MIEYLLRRTSIMDTKLKGDIAEQAAVIQALKRGWGVLKPVGDRLPYDLVFDIGGALMKVQVKSSWFSESTSNYVVDNRRTKTNRRLMVREAYTLSDFDFALIYLNELDLFYVFPVDVFIGYGSEIHLVEADKRQRKPRSADFRDRWDLIVQEALGRTMSGGINLTRQAVSFPKNIAGHSSSDIGKRHEKK
jgi:hypothetical protein